MKYLISSIFLFLFFNSVGLLSQTWTRYPAKFDSTLNGITEKGNIKSFEFDSLSNLLYSNSSEIGKFNGSSWSIFNHLNTNLTDPQDWNIRDIAVSKDGKYIGASERGLIIDNGNDWVRFNKANTNINNEYIINCKVDRDNNVWFLTQGQSIYKYNWTSFEQEFYAVSSNAPKASPYSSLRIEPDGTAWYFSFYSVVKVQNKSFVTYDSSSMKISSEATISCIDYSSKTGLIVGTAMGEVVNYDGSNWINLQSPLGVMEPVAQICIDDSMKLCVATRNKLLEYDLYSKSWKTIELPNDTSIAFLQITALNVDSKHRLWMGTTTSGIFMYDSNPISVFDKTVNILFQISPNPVSDFLSINSNFEIGRIEIYSVFGLKVLETECQDKINVSGLLPGVYFVRIGDIVNKFLKI